MKYSFILIVLFFIKINLFGQTLNCSCSQGAFEIASNVSATQHLVLLKKPGKIAADTILRFPKNQPFEFKSCMCNDSLLSILYSFGGDVVLSVFKSGNTHWTRTGGAVLGAENIGSVKNRISTVYRDFKLIAPLKVSYKEEIQDTQIQEKTSPETWETTIEVQLHSKKLKNTVVLDRKKL